MSTRDSKSKLALEMPIKDRNLRTSISYFCCVMSIEYDENLSDDRVPILSGCKTRALRRWILRIHGLFE